MCAQGERHMRFQFLRDHWKPEKTHGTSSTIQVQKEPKLLVHDFRLGICKRQYLPVVQDMWFVVLTILALENKYPFYKIDIYSHSALSIVMIPSLVVLSIYNNNMLCLKPSEMLTHVIKRPTAFEKWVDPVIESSIILQVQTFNKGCQKGFKAYQLALQQKKLKTNVSNSQEKQ